jgi:hypothetical protein
VRGWFAKLSRAIFSEEKKFRAGTGSVNSRPALLKSVQLPATTRSAEPKAQNRVI